MQVQGSLHVFPPILQPCFRCIAVRSVCQADFIPEQPVKVNRALLGLRRGKDVHYFLVAKCIKKLQCPQYVVLSATASFIRFRVGGPSPPNRSEP